MVPVPVTLSVDPLAEDNCRVTPYTYCNGDPVNRIDPDGEEDLFWMDKNDDPYNAMYIYDRYYFKDNPNFIVIWAHGDGSGFNAKINNEIIEVRKAEDFIKLLAKNSELWKENNGKDLTIVLNSCKTAEFVEKELINNEKLQDRNLTIIAPTENVRVRIKEVYKNDRNPLMRWIMGDYKTKTIRLFSVVYDGKWNVFRTGKGLVKTYPGNANPGKKNFRL